MEEETGALINSLKWDESVGKWRGQDERGKEDIGHRALGTRMPGCSATHK